MRKKEIENRLLILEKCVTELQGHSNFSVHEYPVHIRESLRSVYGRSMVVVPTKEVLKKILCYLELDLTFLKGKEAVPDSVTVEKRIKK